MAHEPMRPARSCALSLSLLMKVSRSLVICRLTWESNCSISSNPRSRAIAGRIIPDATETRATPRYFMNPEIPTSRNGNPNSSVSIGKTHIAANALTIVSDGLSGS